MYHIAVCDDELAICSQIEQIIINNNKLLSNKVEVDVFYTGEDLYKYLFSGVNYDMIFLDIELKLLNGVALGEKIRNELNNENVQIVFISGKQGYAMELFEIRPLNFLVKPLDAEKIIQVVEKGIKLLKKSNQYFTYKQGQSTKKILLQDISYFESIDRQVKMITVEEEIIFYGSLSEIFLQLEKYHFFYIHKSFLVNFNHVIEYNYENLVMSNKTVLQISQSRRKSVRAIQIKLEKEA